MKKILIPLFILLANFATSQTTMVGVAAGEYSIHHLKNDGTVWKVFPKVYNTTYVETQLPGLSGIVALDGGQYNSLFLKNDGRVFMINGDSISAASTVSYPLDYYGNAFSAQKIYAMWRMAVAIKNGEVWYWSMHNSVGDEDMLRQFGTLTTPVPLPRKLIQPAGKYIIKIVFASSISPYSTAYMWGLASDGTLWQWDVTHTTPFQVLGKAGYSTTWTGIVTDVVATLNARMVFTSTNQVWCWGYDAQWYGGHSDFSNVTMDNISSNLASAGATFPIKLTASNYIGIQVIDSKNDRYAIGNNEGGNIGNGIMANPFKWNVGLSKSSVYANSSTAGNLAQTTWSNMPGKWKNLVSNNSYVPYWYGQDMAGNWYTWGRGKKQALANGITWDEQFDQPKYPDWRNIPIPRLVTPLTQTWTTEGRIDTAKIRDPIANAGVNQYLTNVAGTTLYGAGSHQQQPGATTTITTTNKWTQVSGPNTAVITNSTSPNTTVTGLTNGTYIFRNTVTNSNSATDFQNVTVNNAVQPKNIYIAAEGLDANSGTDVGHPWGSIAKLNANWSNINPGDSILFRSGDIFYGSIVVGTSGTALNRITIASYGTGAKPVITGFTTMSAWTSIGGGIYTASVTAKPFVNMVTLNGNAQQVGRWPNRGAGNDGFITYTAFTGNTSLTASALSATNWVGAEVVSKKEGYITERNLITAQSGSTINYRAQAAINLRNTSGVQPSPIAPTRVGFGLFIQRDPRTLDSLGEWYYDSVNKKLQMYFGGVAPTSNTVKVSTVDTLINLSNKAYITVSNIAFEGAGMAAIYFQDGSNINVLNNSINNSGARGVMGWNSPNTNVNYNFVNNTMSTGIDVTGRHASNVNVIGNTVKRSGIFPGMNSFYDDNDDQGIFFAVDHYALVQYNTIDTTGYIPIHFQGADMLIDRNWINYCLFIKDDGGGIYTNGSSDRGTTSNPSDTNRQVSNNIIRNCIGAIYGNANPFHAEGIYTDGGARHVNIINNTVDSAANRGIYLNSPQDVNVQGNTLFRVTGIAVNKSYYETVANTVIKHNTIFASASSNRDAKFTYGNSGLNSTNPPVANNIQDALKLVAVIDSNTWQMPAGAEFTYNYRATNGGTQVNNYTGLTLSAWRSYTLHDTHSDSVSVKYLGHQAIVSNPSSSPLIYTFPTLRKLVYPNATLKNNADTIPEYSSRIYVDSGSSSVNVPPTANAGSDKVITLPTNSTTANGSGTDPDGTIASYAWTKVSGPSTFTIVSPSSASTNLTGLVAGTYQFVLTVTDNLGATGMDTMQVLVNPTPNVPPTANAGADKLITLPTNSTSLTGSGTDSDGTITSYAWLKLTGTGGTIGSPTSATTAITGLTAGIYTYQLTVTDNNGATGKDTVQVTVNAAPTSNAGSDKNITLPTNTTTLNGSGTGATAITYQWVKITGGAATIVNPTSATTTINNLVAGTYNFQLTVTDANGNFARDTAQVIVNPTPNVPPVADAGANQTITLPTSSVTVSGSGSTDSDGTITAYSWTKVSGGAATITTTNSVSTTITGLVAGTYQFQLQVTDNSGATNTDIMQVTVNPKPNVPPTANAGANQTITLPTNLVSLAGTGTDTDGTIVSYSWLKIVGGAATITSPNSANTTITGMAAGNYTFQLTVVDNSGASATDLVDITVNAAPPPNQPPVANAGTSQTIVLPTNTATLTGTATDADGTITSTVWSKLTGSPAGGNITSPSSLTTGLTSLQVGTYTYQLIATDNNAASDTDIVQIIVQPAPNINPVPDAGANQTITLPTSSVTLNGTATDADGSIASYSWSIISGTGGTFTNPNSASTLLTNLTAGIYQIQLTVTDNSGGIGTDVMQVTVNPHVNIPPSVNAGVDQIITLPINLTLLTGIAYDVDGSITGYAWTKIAGPAGGDIITPNLQTTLLTNLAEGTYTYQFTATDNNGGTGTDTVDIVVKAAPIGSKQKVSGGN